MVILSILSALKRFFYALLFWILNNKRWVLIIVLMFYSLTQTWQANHLVGQINVLKQQHADYILQQQIEAEKAKTRAITQEKVWSDQLLNAERNYNAKLKEISADATSAQSAANSMSKQLSEANKRLSSASTKTIIEYTITNSDILEICISEYREVATKADGHAIDVGRLNESWPE